MLDHKYPITREKAVRVVRPSREWMWWLAGGLALATAGLITISVALIGGGDAVEERAYRYVPLHGDSGFFEGLESGTALSGTAAAAEIRENRGIDENSGFLEGLDGPVTAIAIAPNVAGTYPRGVDGGLLAMRFGEITAATVAVTDTGTYVPLHGDSGFFEGLESGTALSGTAAAAEIRENRGIDENSGFLEGLDGPVAAIAIAPNVAGTHPRGVDGGLLAMRFGEVTAATVAVTDAGSHQDEQHREGSGR